MRLLKALSALLILAALPALAQQTTCPAGTQPIPALSIRTSTDTIVVNACQNITTGVVSYSFGGSAFTTGTTTDNFYMVPPGACGLQATTGAFAAAGSVAGTNPGLFRVASAGEVLQGVTSAATNTVNVQCDVTPPTRTTSGKGVTITSVDLYYGVQTTALTSIGAASLFTVTYPAAGAAATFANAAAGGVITATPGTLQLATTTTGQCYHENLALGTPVVLNTVDQRLVVDQSFLQSAAAVTTFQFCGARVNYTVTPL